MRKQYSHGELNIFQISTIPEGAHKIKQKGEIILADSETTGNHHCVKAKDGVEIYENGGVLYLKNSVPVDVYCKVEDRHDTITLEPSIWEIDKAKEWDYLTQEKRNVAD